MKRRELLAAAGALGLSACGSAGQLLVPRTALRDSATPSNDKPYVFLARMLDLHASGSTLRLAQSFLPTPQLDLGDLAFTYDNAVAICAFLARGTDDDIARARLLGDTLVRLENAASPNGLLRWDYHTDPLFTRQGQPRFPPADGGIDTGNMAWAGMALMHLFYRTQNSKYVKSAVNIADWIGGVTVDKRGAGGFTGGLNARGQSITWKSTEHNIDAYALFEMLHRHSGVEAWRTYANAARSFIDSMWNANGGYYWVGTGTDGKTVNKDFVAEDVQTWSYLATGRAQYAGSLDWAVTHLAASQGGFSGVSFSDADRSGVWFEGTAHLAAALQLRDPNDPTAKTYLASLAKAEERALNADGYGIVAASKNGLRTGDGDKYYAALHVGATAWYCLAMLGSNPFALG